MAILIAVETAPGIEEQTTSADQRGSEIVAHRPVEVLSQLTEAAPETMTTVIEGHLGAVLASHQRREGRMLTPISPDTSEMTDGAERIDREKTGREKTGHEKIGHEKIGHEKTGGRHQVAEMIGDTTATTE